MQQKQSMEVNMTELTLQKELIDYRNPATQVPFGMLEWGQAKPVEKPPIDDNDKTEEQGASLQ